MTTIKSKGGKKGAVLIVVLGVLAVLALLATTFATLQMTERQIARNYLDMVRAKLLAMSGVEDARARLKDYFPFRAFDPSPAAAKAWIYCGAEKDRYNNVPIPAPIEKAVGPSFAYEINEAVQDPTIPNLAQTIMIEGQPRGFSGVMSSGAYGSFTEHYALKISDLSGRLFVNDGVEGGPNGSVSQNLRRILNVLGQIKPSVDVPDLGDTILAARPATGYRHIDELLAALGYDKAAFGRVREFVTVHAWVDPNVANPVPLSAATEARDSKPVAQGGRGFSYYRGSPALYRFGKSKDSYNADLPYAPAGLETCPPLQPTQDPSQMAAACVYGLDTLNPQWIEIVSRAPVNVNVAPREVLAALLQDLRGFFLTERRRNNPNFAGDVNYNFFRRRNTFSSEEAPTALGATHKEGDEFGYLMQTPAITGTLAGTIADHLLACRNLTPFGGFDYGGSTYVDSDGVTKPLWWKGPFRNWIQFNKFVDNLVTLNVLEDTRNLWFDYDLGSLDPTGYGPLVASPVQKLHASCAMADMLKANFNPNLHLNELNPDRNLYTIVDKTDLVVNSTEFTFLPTGCFEIESLGRVLRPKDGAQDARLADNDLMAHAKVTALYKIYDLTRETNQRQFYGGTLAPRTGAYETNNDKSVEVGPEPDNGVMSDDTHEWDGYVALPTVGSIYHNALSKPQDTLWRTIGNVPSTPHLGSVAASGFHVHFTLDSDACHHNFDRQEIASRTLVDERVDNFGDLPGLYGGPYDPNDGVAVGGNTPVHRQAKSFRLKPGVTQPSITLYAPSDLRIDGGYSERHSSPAYYMHKGASHIWNFNNADPRGMVSFWAKPSFDPELTASVRTFWNLARFHYPCDPNKDIYNSPFMVWFFPSHYYGPELETADPLYRVGGMDNTVGKFRPCSITMGSLQWHDTPAVVSNYPWGMHGFSRATTSLNHQNHPDQGIKPDLLKGRQWMNITFSFHLRGLSENSEMYINGSAVYMDFNWLTIGGGWGAEGRRMIYFNRHDDRSAGQCIHDPQSPPCTHPNPPGYDTPGPASNCGPYLCGYRHGYGNYNHARFGATSKISDHAQVPYNGNHPADATLDEIYLWRQAPSSDPSLSPQVLWRRGRYYKPMGANEGTFTSRAIALDAGAAGRVLPPASSVTPPPSTVPVPPPGTLVVEPPTVRVLGVAWTWYGEAVDKDGNRALYDWSTTSDGSAGQDVKPKVRMMILDSAVPATGYDNDGFSAVRASDGSTPILQNPAGVKYRAHFFLDPTLVDPLNTILLASPVLDDVTLYWDNGRAEPLSYVYDNRSF